MRRGRASFSDEVEGFWQEREFVCFVSSLSFCHEKATVALCLNESAPAQELSISKFSDCFFDFVPMNLLLVRNH